jgi:hypothetical protein
MKRRIVASLAVSLALTGRGWAQSPSPTPTAPKPGPGGRAKVVIPDAPRGASRSGGRTSLAIPDALSLPPPGEARATIVVPDSAVSDLAPVPVDPPPAVKPIEVPAAPADKPAVPAPLPAPAAAACQPPNGCPKPPLIDTHCGPCEQIWGRLSYLNWRIEDLPLPQVLAVGAAGNTLLGDTNVDFGNFNGGKLEFGTWLNARHTLGVEFGGFILQERDRSATVGSDGSATIIRPSFDPVTNRFQPFFVSTPGILALGVAPQSGALALLASSQLASAEFNFVRNLAYCPTWSFDALVGVRYIQLEEDVQLRQTSNQLLLPGPRPTPANPGFLVDRQPGFSVLEINDRFQTRNQFWGGQVGGRFEARRGIWFGSLTGKVALGNNHQVTVVTGETNGTNPAGGRRGAVGGFLAVPGGTDAVNPFTNQVIGVNPLANAGTQKTDWFTVAPEVGLQVGAQVTHNVRVHVGYNFLYMNNVVRPGDVINNSVNFRFVPSTPDYKLLSGSAQPAVRTSRDDFSAHGVELGVSVLF